MKLPEKNGAIGSLRRPGGYVVPRITKGDRLR